MLGPTMGSSPANDPIPRVPSPGDVLLGKYVVERVLAAGGMGVVVSARHAQLDRRVALKFLLPEVVTEPELVDRFMREAKVAAALRGEHVVRVIDFGALDDGSPFMVMEHLDGNDLREELQQYGPLPIPMAVGYILQACEALAEAHAAGIVHRDVKPSNLFKTCRPDGSVAIKVLDFGISKVVQGVDARLTSTSTMLGSPYYMSPEQIRNAKTVDSRSDIWAVGVTLHELVTGDVPFAGDNVTSLSAAIVVDEPTRIRSVRPECPEALESVVLKCLQKEPEDRYQSAGELAAALVSLAPAEAHVSARRAAGISRVSVADVRPESAERSFADTVATQPVTAATPPPLTDTRDGASTVLAQPGATAARGRTVHAALLALVLVAFAALAVHFGSSRQTKPTAGPADHERMATEPADPVVNHSVVGPVAPAAPATTPSGTPAAHSSEGSAAPEPLPSQARPVSTAGRVHPVRPKPTRDDDALLDRR